MTLIFCSNKRKHITSLKFILYSFELLSVLAINFEKSMVLSIGISQSIRDQLAEILESRTADFPLIYLGMPLHCGKLRANDWSLLIKKIVKKLVGLKAKLLIMARRATLLNAIISPLVLFWMTNLILLAGTIKNIDKLHRAFLWNGNKGNKVGKNLLNWITICRPKEVGGMRITNLKIQNQIIFCKWWWNVFKDNRKPWRELIQTRYYSNQIILLKQPTTRKLLEVWRSMLKVQCLFQALVKFIVGNGKQILFWEDSWLLDQPIKERFPLLYIASSFKEITVAEAFEISIINGWWSLIPLLNNHPDQHTLEDMLKDIRLSNKSDSINWKWFSAQTFSTK